MSSWEYRIGVTDGIYAIYEVYYNDGGEIDGMSLTPCCPEGETPEELKQDIELFREALEKPVLNWDKYFPRKE